MNRNILLSILFCVFSSTQSIARESATRQAVLDLFDAHMTSLKAIDDARPQGTPERDFSQSVTLDGCILTWQTGMEPDTFGLIHILDLATADIRLSPVAPSPALPFERLQLRTSPATMVALAPALWAYMDGDPAAQPSSADVVDAYSLYDPLGASEWWDPSMMTLAQQNWANTRWDAARDADATGLLARHNTAWSGPVRLLFRPILITPGTMFELLLPAGNGAAAVTLFQDFTANGC